LREEPMFRSASLAAPILVRALALLGKHNWIVTEFP
jgi:hypothetical protein